MAVELFGPMKVFSEQHVFTNIACVAGVSGVPTRTSVPNASAKSRAGREKNGKESSENSLAGVTQEGVSGFAAKSFAPFPPTT